MMARKGLGRGLEAILGDAPSPLSAPPSRAGGIQTVPLGEILPDPDQPRKTFDPDALEELADSLKAQGVLQPILIRRGDGAKTPYIIIAGERRWRAAAKAGLHEIPALIRDADPAAISEMALIENLQRTDLNPIEEAEAYARMKDVHGRKPGDIATAVGKSRSHVANMLRLCALDDEVKTLLRDGSLSMGHARALLSVDKPKKLAQLIVHKGLSVRQAEALAKGVARDKKTLEAQKNESNPPPSSGGSKDADTRSLENDLEAVLGLSVAIEHGKKGGRVTLTYDTLDQLDDICRRLMGAAV